MSSYLGLPGGPYLRLSKRGAQQGGFETVGATSQSINGTTTSHVRALKRSWQITTRALSTTELAQLLSLRYTRPVALSFYDDTLPNLLPRARREMVGWLLSTGAAATGSGGVAPSPTLGMQLRLAASSSAAPYAWTGPAVGSLIPVTPGDVFNVGVDLQNYTASPVTVSYGLRFYNSAGTYVTANGPSVGVPAASGLVRYNGLSTPGQNATLRYAQPFVTAGAGDLGVSDVTVMPGVADLGGGWRSVLLTDLNEEHPTPNVRFATLTLQEV